MIKHYDKVKCDSDYLKNVDCFFKYQAPPFNDGSSHHVSYDFEKDDDMAMDADSSSLKDLPGE